ncbi:MAG TPA: Crp/Fnr family transcriptional regulator [Phaeodactylibacter sp.]|nr:Crp/Fnr family transcriptional regulator [Phaeodactylibacter sp.]
MIHPSPIDQLHDLITNHHAWAATQTLPRNAMLKTEGSVDTNIYYIESGSIRIFLYSEEEEHTIRFGYERNFITALDSFISEQPSDLYMQAIRKTEVKWVSKPRYMEIVNSKPEYIALYNQLLEQLVLQQMEREQDLLINSPEERYRRVLQRSPQLFQEIPHKYIASYLRMTPETLSRVKKS